MHRRAGVSYLEQFGDSVTGNAVKAVSLGCSNELLRTQVGDDRFAPLSRHARLGI
jgi:hypothetical protein